MGGSVEVAPVWLCPCEPVENRHGAAGLVLGCPWYPRWLGAGWVRCDRRGTRLGVTEQAHADGDAVGHVPIDFTLLLVAGGPVCLRNLRQPAVHTCTHTGMHLQIS